MEKQIGKVNFTKGHVTITDPSYAEGTWCTAEVENVFKGEWEASAEIKDCGDWGNRVAKLILKAVNQTAIKYQKLSADIGVDAGVCGIFEDKPDYNDSAWYSFCDELCRSNCGLASTSNAFHCEGAWSSSGYGDGSYEATIGLNEIGEVVEITVDYLLDEEDYDEDEEDYEELDIVQE